MSNQKEIIIHSDMKSWIKAILSSTLMCIFSLPLIAVVLVLLLFVVGFVALIFLITSILIVLSYIFTIPLHIYEYIRDMIFKKKQEKEKPYNEVLTNIIEDVIKEQKDKDSKYTTFNEFRAKYFPNAKDDEDKDKL